MPRDDWKKLPRLYVTEALRKGQHVPLDTAQQHYLTHVMRRSAGSQLLLFNGQDGEWLATLEPRSKNSAAAACTEQTRPQTPTLDLRLLFAPIKREHLDYLIQKASELGVAHLQPVLTQHTVAPRLNPSRLHAIAREAAEQCERLTLPTLGAAMPLDIALSQWRNDQPLFACLESGTAQPLATAMSGKTAATSAAILTGPEGGFSTDEMELIRRHPSTIPVSLGPRILRADTAALAALAVWQALLGDGR